MRRYTCVDKKEQTRVVDNSGRRFIARLSEFDTIVAYIDAACATLAAEDRLRIALLVEELFANTVNHGYGGDSDGPVWLGLEATTRGCRIVYEDCAPAYDPFAALNDTTDATLEERPIGGLGLLLLAEMSSRRRYERRGNRNVVELEVPSSA